MNLPFNNVWAAALDRLLTDGVTVSPRGQDTYELPQATYTVDTRRPVLTIPERGLSYRFMAAEAWWILEGRDDVASIAPYSSKISQFSDDGERFFGAYGPKIAAQLPYVVQKLVEDEHSRQAGLTIWRENPPATRDVPCTVSIFFQLRRDRFGDLYLNCHVFMRSSDAWLGIPYDVFNFSMLTHYVAGFLNQRMAGLSKDDHVTPGLLYLTAASAHLYARDAAAAKSIAEAARVPRVPGEPNPYSLAQQQPSTPTRLHREPKYLVELLSQLKDAPRTSELRWWEA